MDPKIREKLEKFLREKEKQVEEAKKSYTNIEDLRQLCKNVVAQMKEMETETAKEYDPPVDRDEITETPIAVLLGQLEVDLATNPFGDLHGHAIRTEIWRRIVEAFDRNEYPNWLDLLITSPRISENQTLLNTVWKVIFYYLNDPNDRIIRVLRRL